jgi:3,4-dihydroxy 2-butanone 4-phosphate synthase/GTP cyclohydrolase II
LGSLQCDCGPQLQTTLKFIEKYGEGIVLYLFQEGRGINIINKLKAYNLQKSGRDTIEANEELGFPPDLREYNVVNDILKDLQVKSIKLITNNPEKVRKLIETGINLEGVMPIEIPPIPENHFYLSTKALKMDHNLHYLKS